MQAIHFKIKVPLGDPREWFSLYQRLYQRFNLLRAVKRCRDSGGVACDGYLIPTSFVLSLIPISGLVPFSLLSSGKGFRQLLHQHCQASVTLSNPHLFSPSQDLASLSASSPRRKCRSPASLPLRVLSWGMVKPSPTKIIALSPVLGHSFWYHVVK